MPSETAKERRARRARLERIREARAAEAERKKTAALRRERRLSRLEQRSTATKRSAAKKAKKAAAAPVKKGAKKAATPVKKGAKKAAAPVKKGAKKAAAPVKKGAKKAAAPVKKGAKKAAAKKTAAQRRVEAKRAAATARRRERARAEREALAAQAAAIAERARKRRERRHAQQQMELEAAAEATAEAERVQREAIRAGFLQRINGVLVAPATRPRRRPTGGWSAQTEAVRLTLLEIFEHVRSRVVLRDWPVQRPRVRPYLDETIDADLHIDIPPDRGSYEQIRGLLFFLDDLFAGIGKLPQDAHFSISWCLANEVQERRKDRGKKYKKYQGQLRVGTSYFNVASSYGREISGQRYDPGTQSLAFAAALVMLYDPTANGGRGGGILVRHGKPPIGVIVRVAWARDGTCRRRR